MKKVVHPILQHRVKSFLKDCPFLVTGSLTFKIEPIGSIALDYNTLALFHKGVSFCSAFEASLYRAHIACHHSAAT